MDESLLIARCRQQDKKAQRALYDAYAERLMPVCLRYVKNLPDAEDALLNGFYKFFHTLSSFEYNGAGSIYTWLKKIVVNECLMLLRKRPSIKWEDEETAAEAALNIDIFYALEAKEIFMLIAALPDGYRTVFNLYAVEGYSHKEIANLLSIAEGTSKSQLSKAKALLQKVLIKHHNYAAGK